MQTLASVGIILLLGCFGGVAVIVLSLGVAVAALQPDPAVTDPVNVAAAERSHIRSELAEGRRLLSRIDGCSLAGVPAIQELLRKYERRSEPELRLLTAEARYRAADALRFRGHDEEAEHWFGSVVQFYGREGDVRFKRIVARSNYMLGTIGRNGARKERYLRRVLSTYRETQDFDLLKTYADSIFALADIRNASKREADANQLIKEASELYRTRIIPHLPPPDPNTPICI